MSGVVAALAAARHHSRTLLVESSGLIGGLITGGRLTKPTGLVQAGGYRDLLERTASHGGGDPRVQYSYWGAYTGVFDAELMQRAIIELLEEAGVEVLVFAHAIDTVRTGGRVAGVIVDTKSGEQCVLGRVVIDATGDGDVATLAGAPYSFGRASDGQVQPMTSYMRVLNVDFRELASDCQEHPEDVRELVLPREPGGDNAAYALVFFMTGFMNRIERARKEGFAWIIPKDHLTLKAGLLPGEVNVNATRFHGNALDARTRSRAVIEIRKQAYCAFDFLKTYVRGFGQAVLLEVAPVLGVRETRRVTGDYVLTEGDVTGEARFADAIGLSNCPIDIHEPGGEGGRMQSVGAGYGIPYRCLLPRDVDGVLLAGRCISVDAAAFASTRNTPACALTAEAAGVAAAVCASKGLLPREVDVSEIQGVLRDQGVVLGVAAGEDLGHLGASGPW